MKLPQSTPLAVAVLSAGLLIGGTGGAIAAGQIGTNDIRNGAVTTPKIHDKAVTASKLAPSARGAKVIQYIASGAGLPGSLDVTLPGTWSSKKLGKSGWMVEFVRNGSSGALFALGQSAPAGEEPTDGFYITLGGSSATVHITGASYGSIDTIRIVRTISTSHVAGTLSRNAPRGSTHR